MTILPKKEILGVGITSASHDEILEYVLNSLRSPQEKYYIVTPNPEIIIYAARENSFKKVLNKAEIALCDGIGLYIAANVVGKGLKERVTGTDLVESICKASVREGKDDVRKPVSIGFLGAGPGIALKASECLREKYPGLSVSFADAEFSQGKFPETDILFVAYGFPKQELFMAEQIDTLPVKIMMGVGGALDYISGSVPRAPRIFRALGLEWLFRLIRQPWRWRRQLALLTFVLLVIKERFFLKK